MTVEHGFELLQDVEIEELKTRGRLYRHVKTGGLLLSLSNDDENKVFGISFRTPPRNSTGVAHILEHSVLCGSRKYPVKEPFVELLKGSLKTFLNAFTYPDKTCYPVASQNLQDFYNLVDVYLDAVLHPRLSPHIFQQEGWHYELEDVDGPLSYKGVVFNEMKGSYSSPESVLAEKSQQVVFPDTTYGLDSGGNPREIPKLTYEEFLEFHRNHYHPSNAFVFFCGDDDPSERLRLVNDYFKEFDRREIDSTVQLQRRLEEPRREKAFFPWNDQETAESGGRPKGMITVNWLLPETREQTLCLSLQILRHILLGLPGSPLRKALIDSGLGDDIAGVGLETDLRQMYFSVGLKGIATESATKVESLILDTLQRLASEGIDPDSIEAALNTIEFRLRENNTGSFPRGLVLMLRSLTNWLHGEDPFVPLQFEAALAEVRSHLERKSPFFEKLIREHFLNNPHRVTLVLHPDVGLSAALEVEEREELEAVRRALSHEQLESLAANTRELRRLQEEPDSPEALATIPVLRISDLEKENKKLPLEVLTWEGSEILYHDLFTNGIVYLDVGFNLHHLPQAHVPYFRLFGRAFTEMGTEADDYVKLGQRIGRKTGGIQPELFTSSVFGQTAASIRLFLRTKCMPHQVKDLFAILKDLLHTVRLDNRDRFRQMLLEEKARQEQKIVPNGHQVVNMRLRSHFSEADWVAEQMGGVSYLAFLRQLTTDFDAAWPGVLKTLEEMRATLLNRDAMLFNVTLDASSWSSFEPDLHEFIASIPTGDTANVSWSMSGPDPFEGLLIPAQVNYVGKGCSLFDLGYVPHGSTQVISGYLRTSWLWERIRVQGGAYGAFCLFDRVSGVFTFVSYRDPNVLKTLDSFDKTSQFLRESQLSEEELQKAIIGAIGGLDAYHLPDAKGYLSMLRYLIGDTEEMRQKMRDEILSTTREDFKAFASVLDGLREAGLVKVLGSEAALEALENAHPGKFRVTRVL